jgi:hypothetical protein
MVVEVEPAGRRHDRHPEGRRAVAGGGVDPGRGRTRPAAAPRASTSGRRNATTPAARSLPPRP